MEKSSIERERLIELLHVETVLEMIRESIEEMERENRCPEEILEDIKMTLRI